MTKMTVMIPSVGRAESMTTPEWLDASGVDYRVVVHTTRDADEYMRAGTPSARILVSHAPYGMCQARQGILDTFVAEGDWVLMLDDDITKCTALPAPLYDRATLPFAEKYDGRWQRAFNQPCSAAKFLDLAGADAEVAEANGAYLVGWSPVTNYYFRGTKYREVGYVEGEAIGVRKSDLRYDMRLNSMDDIGFTAQNLARFGRVLINHYVFPKGQHWQPGGLGSYEGRLEGRLRDTAYLMETYAGLLRYKKVKGRDPHSDLALRWFTTERIAKWRRDMGFLTDAERAAEAEEVA